MPTSNLGSKLARENKRQSLRQGERKKKQEGLEKRMEPQVGRGEGGGGEGLSLMRSGVVKKNFSEAPS